MPSQAHPIDTMTDQSTRMNDAINVNNIAIKLLKAGCLEDALVTFKAAAQLMYPVSQFFQAQAGEKVSRPVPYRSHEDSEDLIKAANDKLALLEPACPPRKKLKMTTQDTFLSTEPFLIQQASKNPTSCTLESATIVFNMALAYNLSGSRPCVEKALSLFEMAFSLAFSMNDSGSSLAPKLAMASLNNAGNLHYSLGNYQASRQYLDTLSSFIIALPSTSSEESLRERHDLLLNAMLLQAPTIAGAA